MANEIVTRTARHFIGDDGIVRSIMLPGAEQTEGDAEENIRACGTLLKEHQRCPALIDYRRMRSMDRGARTYYSGPEPARVMSAAAILIESPLSRIIGTFFMGLHKPLVPTRLFTSEAEALAWLQSFTGSPHGPHCPH